ncbi:MAG: malate synthase G, partial [Ferrovibrionaceae bacterium]
MTATVTLGNLAVARPLYDFVNQEALPGTGIEPAALWQSLEAILVELMPVNQVLLAKRDALQARIDAWHRERRGQAFDHPAYRAFLRDIGYLQPEVPDFKVGTANVDPEIAEVAGPQLVVPVMNARYALNAANARWGSLYDALYGTDAIPEDGGATRGGGYNPVRGARVIAHARALLDQAAPLAEGSHGDAVGYAVRDGALAVMRAG